MKIVYVANFRIPTEKAHGYQVAKMCESFASHMDVELVIPTRRNEIKQDLYDYYGMKRKFEVTYIHTPDFIAMSPLLLRRMGFFLQSFFYLAALFLKRKGFFSSLNQESTVQKENISSNSRTSKTIIYSRNPEIVFLFSRLGYKTIFESHRFPQSKKWLHKIMVRRVAKIIAVTSGLKELYLKAGINEKNILVSPDGVDTAIFDVEISKEKAREELNLPQNDIFLGYTGSPETMGEEKGMAEIFYTLRKLTREGNIKSKIIFTAVGGNKEQHKKYQALAQDFGVSERVIFIESVERKKLALYQKAFDILLMPFPRTTHYSYYMSPLKMFEYMASKRPIVASDLPSIREVLNEENAVLFEPDNPDSLAKGIEKLINDLELALKISDQAYEDVRRFTWEKRANKILEFIN